MAEITVCLDEGRVTFDGRDLTNRAPEVIARAGIARTFQLVRVFRIDDLIAGTATPVSEFNFGQTVPEGVLLRPVRSLPSTRLEDVIGCAGYRGPARSAADMERAIAQGVKARRGRGRY